jgi:hypothetical protein
VTGFHREVPLAEGRGRRPVMMEDSKGTVTVTPGRATGTVTVPRDSVTLADPAGPRWYPASPTVVHPATVTVPVTPGLRPRGHRGSGSQGRDS